MLMNRIGLICGRFLQVTCAAAIFTFLSSPAPSWADTFWQAGTGNWFASTNWTAGVPDSSAAANINNGGTAEIASGAAAVSSLNLGQAATDSGLLTISGGTLGIAIQEAVGVAGTGTITHTAGSNNLGTGVVVMGVSANSNGTYNLSGTGVLSGLEYIGESGVGTMNQSGGTNNATTIYMASANLNTTGTYNLSGGALTATTINLGYQGTGIFTQTGGIFSVSQGLNIINSKSVLSIANALDSTASLGNGGLLSLAGAASGATAGQLNVTSAYNQSSQRELDIGIRAKCRNRLRIAQCRWFGLAEWNSKSGADEWLQPNQRRNLQYHQLPIPHRRVFISHLADDQRAFQRQLHVDRRHAHGRGRARTQHDDTVRAGCSIDLVLLLRGASQSLNCRAPCPAAA